MSKSDFFVIITIALAIVALFSERNRKFYLLKFSKVEWIVISFFFAGVHFFVWSEEWTFWRGSVVDIPSCPLPTTWAYLLFVIILIYIVHKLCQGKFPECNYESLLREYLNLLAIKDIPFLSKLVSKYHFSAVIEYYESFIRLKVECKNKMVERKREQVAECKADMKICDDSISKLKKKKDLSDSEKDSLMGLLEEKSHLEMEFDALNLDEEISYPDIQKKYLNDLNKLQLSDKNNKFAIDIIEQIIRNEDFISSVVDFNPIFFCPLIKYQVEIDEFFLNTILKYLIKKKNIQFFKEVNKAVKCGFTNGSPLNHFEYPILYSFLENINIASNNFIWLSVGEEALLELREEITKDPSYLRTEMPDNDYSKDSLFSNSKIFIAINFFDVMESSFLLQESESDDWILYYSFFTEYLLKNLKSGNLQNNHKTCAYYLIKQMVIHLCGDLWSLATEKQNNFHKDLIINCINAIKRQIENTKKLNSIGKIELLEDLQI